MALTQHYLSPKCLQQPHVLLCPVTDVPSGVFAASADDVRRLRRDAAAVMRARPESWLCDEADKVERGAYADLAALVVSRARVFSDLCFWGAGGLVAGAFPFN